VFVDETKPGTIPAEFIPFVDQSARQACETGVLAGGPLTAMLDGCCGMSVATMLKAPEPFATLDLRIDYVRPAEPGKAVIAEAECYRITRSVAFTRAFAHHGDAKDPIAAAAGTFMLGTKGKPTRPPLADKP
jgi:uncharacterized protein (TIGR00369 family)